MITIAINQGLFSTIGLVWGAVTGIAVLVSIVLLVIVIRDRIKQRKKGEEYAYRNY